MRNPHPPAVGDETVRCAGCGQLVAINDDLATEYDTGATDDPLHHWHVNCEPECRGECGGDRNDPERQRFNRAMGV